MQPYFFDRFELEANQTSHLNWPMMAEGPRSRGILARTIFYMLYHNNRRITYNDLLQYIWIIINFYNDNKKGLMTGRTLQEIAEMAESNRELVWIGVLWRIRAVLFDLCRIDVDDVFLLLKTLNYLRSMWMNICFCWEFPSFQSNGLSRTCMKEPGILWEIVGSFVGSHLEFCGKYTRFFQEVNRNVWKMTKNFVVSRQEFIGM